MISFTKNRTTLYIGTAVALVLLLTSTVAFIVSRSNKKQSQPDPSIANDERIRKEQENNQLLPYPTSPETSNTPQGQKQPDQGDRNSTDPIEKGKALAGGNCTGTGSKKLGSAPMRTEEMSIIVPYGLLAAGHVTPIDHQYYWGKIQMGDADMYDVLSPGDGKLVELQYRDKSNEGRKIKGDYRGVIMYSCTFFSYFDLATSMSQEIQKQLPQNWEQKGVIHPDISLKEGQVIGKVGGQSLDFAIWDTTKSLKNLLVPTAYNNTEPWKINTVPPLDYFTDSVKQKILPLYTRKVEPLDGVIDQDMNGKAVGSWFLEGTNGYAKVFEYGPNGGGGDYYTGHLSLVRDHLDPTGWVFSKGNVQGSPQQFAIKSPKITPENLTTSSGIVKYELAQWNHVDENGKIWIGGSIPQSIKMSSGTTKGTALVQLLDTRKLKIEVFIGKTPSQITGFTSAAETFDRGDDAKMIESNTAQ